MIECCEDLRLCDAGEELRLPPAECVAFVALNSFEFSICSLGSGDSAASRLLSVGEVIGELFGELMCVKECDLEEVSLGELGGKVEVEELATFMLPTTLLQRNWHALGVLSFK